MAVIFNAKFRTINVSIPNINSTNAAIGFEKLNFVHCCILPSPYCVFIISDFFLKKSTPVYKLIIQQSAPGRWLIYTNYIHNKTMVYTIALSISIMLLTSNAIPSPIAHSLRLRSSSSKSTPSGYCTTVDFGVP